MKRKAELLFSLYARAFDRRSATQLMLALLVSLVAALLASQAPVVLKSLFDRLAEPGVSKTAAIQGALGLVAILAGAKLVGELRWLWLGQGEQAIDRNLSADAFKRALALKSAHLRAMGEGIFAARFAQGLEGTRLLVQQSVVALAPALFEVLAAIVIILISLPASNSLLVLGGAGLAGLAYQWSAWRAGPDAGAINAARAELSRQTQDAMTHIELIKIERAHEPMRERFEAALADQRSAWLRHYRARALNAGLAHCVFGLGFGLSFAFAAAETAQGRMSIGELVLAHAAFLQLARPLEMLGLSLRDGAEFSARALDLALLLDGPNDDQRDDRSAAKPFAGASSGAPALEFCGVSYEAGARQVVRDVSFAIARGRFVALVGPSGSGKSSLARLALGLIDPACGAIRLNGVLRPDISTGHARGFIAAALQEPAILDASLGFNASLGAGASEAQIAGALDAAGLRWRTRQDGLKGRTGPRGAFLSGGERQRLALARLALKRADLVILDEAFSALDAPSEYELLSRLKRERGDAALLVITHRMSHIADADLILLMEEGRLVDQGAHGDLLTRSPLYRSLCAEGDERAAADPASADSAPESARA